MRAICAGWAVLLLAGCEEFTGKEGAGDPGIDPLQVLIGKGEVTGNLDPFPLVDDPDYLPV